MTEEVDVPPYAERTTELFSSSKIMELTGCSRSEMMGLISRGLIRAVDKTRQGWALYGEDALRVVVDFRRRSKKKKTESEMPLPDLNYSATNALIVFKMIKDGMSFEDIVLKSKIHPRMVRGIVREYQNLAGAIVVYKEFVDKINKLPLNGTFPITDGEGIFDVLNLAADDSRCATCQRNPKSSHCSACERKKVIKNIAVRQARAPKTPEPSEESGTNLSDADQAGSTKEKSA